MFETYDNNITEWLAWLCIEKYNNYSDYVTTKEFMNIFNEDYENLILED